MRRSVSPAQTKQILTLFEQVVSLNPDMRAAYLDEACADDPSLRHEVELLLENYDQTGSSDALGDAVNAFLAAWPEASPVQPGHQVSHYQVLEQLGGGGMGVVYKARDRRLDRTVALKFLPAPLSLHEEAKERFIREAKAASALDHVNICTIYDIGATDPGSGPGQAPGSGLSPQRRGSEQAGQLFIAMACYEGETLKEKIVQGRLPVREALGYAIQIAEGLQAAHEVGIVHRDVKPANVVVTDRGVVKLLDFGIAKVADVNLTRTGVTPGTVAYMSPEQTRGEDVDGRTDIWSLAVVLYEMLTEQRPFQGHYEQAVIYGILHVDPEPVTALRAEVPQALATILRRALAKNRAHRYADMASLLAALRAVQQERGLVPGAPSGASQTIPSIAVLPFADMSSGRDQDYFCEGVAEELLNALTQVEGLRVASRTSSFQFKGKAVDVREIGERLHVTTVLEGSVRKAANRLRVTVQLINAADGYHLWSERYDREIEDVFAVQDEIAQNTVRALRGVLTEKDRKALRKAPPADIEAYEYYLRGRQFLHQLRRSSLDFARQLFKRTIEIDPDYAPAYAATAFCNYFLYMWFGHSEADLSEADRASRKAVELAPELAEPHVARGLALVLAKAYADAERALETALRLNPDLYDANYFFARICFMQGKFERSAVLFERAAEIDPHEYQASCLLGQVYVCLGRPEAAREQYRRGLRRAKRHLELNPDDVRAIYLGGGALIEVGEKERGLEWTRRALTMEPDDPVVLWCAACHFSSAGELDEALDLLERAVALGIANRGWIEHDPDMDPLRDHPRFQALLEQMDR